MNLLGVEQKVITNNESNIDSYYWEYNPTLNDYFLVYKPSWQQILGNAYVFQIKNDYVIIPSGLYIIIGDINVGMDCVRVDETLNRGFEALMVKSSLVEDSWALEEFHFIGQYEKFQQIYPFTKNIVISPLQQSGYSLFLSTKNQYNKIMNYGFNDII